MAGTQSRRSCSVDALHDLGEREIRDQYLVDALLIRPVIDTERRRRVSLRVEVDDQNPRSGTGECRREVDGGRRLSDAALLVRDRQHASRRGQRENRLFERNAPTGLVGKFVSQGSSSVIE